MKFAKFRWWISECHWSSRLSYPTKRKGNFFDFLGLQNCQSTKFWSIYQHFLIRPKNWRFLMIEPNNPNSDRNVQKSRLNCVLLSIIVVSIAFGTISAWSPPFFNYPNFLTKKNPLNSCRPILFLKHRKNISKPKKKYIAKESCKINSSASIKKNGKLLMTTRDETKAIWIQGQHVSACWAPLKLAS